MLDISKQSRQDLVGLARESFMTTEAPFTTRQTLSRAPYLEASDSINFQDCLNRNFLLPFSFVDSWQVRTCT